MGKEWEREREREREKKRERVREKERKEEREKHPNNKWPVSANTRYHAEKLWPAMVKILISIE